MTLRTLDAAKEAKIDHIILLSVFYAELNDLIIGSQFKSLEAKIVCMPIGYTIVSITNLPKILLLSIWGILSSSCVPVITTSKSSFRRIPKSGIKYVLLSVSSGGSKGAVRDALLSRPKIHFYAVFGKNLTYNR